MCSCMPARCVRACVRACMHACACVCARAHARAQAHLPRRLSRRGVFLEPEPHGQGEDDEPERREAKGEERVVAVEVLRVVQAERGHERGGAEGADRRLDAGDLDEFVRPAHEHDEAVVEGVGEAAERDGCAGVKE